MSPLRDATEPIQVQFEELTCIQDLLGPETPDLPNVLPEGSLDTMDIARWGEELVLLYLRHKLSSTAPGVEVHWINETEESGVPYDIVITNQGSAVTYVEVKSTVKEQKELVEISAQQVAFALEKEASVHLYQVFNAGSSATVRLCRLQNLGQHMVTKDVRLFMLL